MADIAILNDVVFPLDPKFSVLADAGFGFKSLKVLERVNLDSNKPAFEIGVDHSSRLAAP